jgi:hypothetical protein
VRRRAFAGFVAALVATGVAGAAGASIFIADDAASASLRVDARGDALVTCGAGACSSRRTGS